MTTLTPGDRDLGRFNAAIRQLYQGGSNNTGKVTLRSLQTTTVVNHESVNPNSHISIMPLTPDAIVAMLHLAIIAYAPKIYTVTHALSSATGNYSFTGVGFKPVFAQCIAATTGSAGWTSVGMSDGTTQTCTGYLSTNGGIGSIGQLGGEFGIVGDNALGTNYNVFDIFSFDSDGFTLGIVKTGSPTANGILTFTLFPPPPVLTAPSPTAGVYVSSRTTGSFTLTHPSNAAVDQTFTYSVTGGS